MYSRQPAYMGLALRILGLVGDGCIRIVADPWAREIAESQVQLRCKRQFAERGTLDLWLPAFFISALSQPGRFCVAFERGVRV